MFFCFKKDRWCSVYSCDKNECEFEEVKELSLNYEMARYTELTGEDGTKVPISRLGGFLDGYEKGINNFLAAVDKADREGVLDYATIEKIAEKLKDGDSD